MLKIREIKPEDSESLSRIIRDVLSSFGAVGEGYAYADWSTDHMYEAYTNSGRKYWVLEDDGIVKGGGGYAELEGEEGFCEIQKMYFLPEDRAKGFGKIILQQSLIEAKKEGYTMAYLETLPQMTTAQELYKRFGFEYLKNRKGRTGHHKCNVWMMKEL